MRRYIAHPAADYQWEGYCEVDLNAGRYIHVKPGQDPVALWAYPHLPHMGAGRLQELLDQNRWVEQNPYPAWNVSEGL